MNALEQLAERRLRQLPAGTNAYRLSDGTHWKGVFIDVLGERILVSLRNTPMPNALLRILIGTGRTVYVKHLEKDAKEAPQHLCGPEMAPRFPIQENGVTYLLDMAAGYSQGLFLDQRDNRAEVRCRCRPGMKVLNTFAYTGAFSVCAALSGAQTTTLDLAQPCLSWCRENMRLNGIAPDDHYFCRGDALHWLDRFVRQKRLFDAIILDPPTFSRDEKGRVWRVESNYNLLVAKAAACLAPGGWLLCTTNCRKLSPSDFRRLVEQGIPHARLSSSPMPFDFDGDAYLKILWAAT